MAFRKLKYDETERGARFIYKSRRKLWLEICSGRSLVEKSSWTDVLVTSVEKTQNI